LLFHLTLIILFILKLISLRNEKSKEDEAQSKSATVVSEHAEAVDQNKKATVVQGVQRERRDLAAAYGFGSLRRASGGKIYPAVFASIASFPNHKDLVCCNVDLPDLALVEVAIHPLDLHGSPNAEALDDMCFASVGGLQDKTQKLQLFVVCTASSHCQHANNVAAEVVAG
jgi:cell division FtsZ-interacting protein ZapD